MEGNRNLVYFLRTHVFSSTTYKLQFFKLTKSQKTEFLALVSFIRPSNVVVRILGFQNFDGHLMICFTKTLKKLFIKSSFIVQFFIINQKLSRRISKKHKINFYGDF